MTPWISAKLSDIARVIMGQSPDSTFYNNDGVGMPFLQGCAQFGRHFPETNIYCTAPAKVAPDSSILFSVRAPVGEINRADRDYCIGRGVAAVVPLKADGSYVESYLRFLRPEFDRIAQGSTFGAINSQDFGSTVIRLPCDRVEQARIAAILASMDRAIQQTEALIAKRERIKVGLTRDLLTRGVDEYGHVRRAHTDAPDLYQCSPLGWIPKDWEVGELGKEIGPIISGWSPNCEPFPADANEWAILKTTAVVWDGYSETENKRLPANLSPVPSLEVGPDDILITRKGPVERVGVVVHVPQTRRRLMIPDTVFKVRLRPHSKVAPAFLPLALGSTSVQKDWFGKKIGLADAQVDINHEIVKGTLFPLPPPSEQEKIVLTLDSVHGELLALKRELQKYERIKNGLAQDLLGGHVSTEILVAMQTMVGSS